MNEILKEPEKVFQPLNRFGLATNRSIDEGLVRIDEPAKAMPLVSAQRFSRSPSCDPVIES